MAYNKEQWRAQVTNGQIPLRLLDKIQPEQFDIDLQGPAVMHPEAAAAMSAFLAAAKKAGHGGLRVKYSYRTLAKQQEKWENFQQGGNLAARPGTSNHGWAVAVDFTWDSSDDIAWAHVHAKEFGYLFDVSSENWHCTYQGGFEMEDKRVDEILKGLSAFLAGDEPNQDGPARRTYRALKKAAQLPEAPTGAKGVTKAEFDLHRHPATPPKA